MTPVFESFIRPARARPQIWRLFLGLILMVVVYAGFVAVFFGVLTLGRRAGLAVPGFEDILEAGTPTALLILLATFIGMALAPMVVVRLLHARGAGTLFGRSARVLRDFAVAAAVYAPVLALAVMGWSFAFDAAPGLPFSTWIMVLPAALVLLLIQTGAEELVFRGYLQQQLAARFGSPIVWAVLPSLLFGIAHFAPSETGENVWIVVGITALFGLLAADLTAKTGSIGAAWGFHFVNNCLALLFLATDGTLTGLAIYVTPYSVDDAIVRQFLVFDVAVMILGWWLIRRLAGRP